MTAAGMTPWQPEEGDPGLCRADLRHPEPVFTSVRTRPITDEREESTRIRNRVKREIIEALTEMPSNEAIAEALMAGRIPHCSVRF